MSSDQLVTVLGAGGWIGSAVVSELRKQGRAVCPVFRTDMVDWLGATSDPGSVIYAIGLTGDFRSKPLETIDAHISLLGRVMKRPRLKSLVYMSSSRVYARATSTHETDPIPCLSSEFSDLYNLSKLMGECLVLQDPRPGFKAVRLSNVVGPSQPTSNFIGSLLHAGRSSGSVVIRQSRDTSKDYIALSDVIKVLIGLSESSRERLYNLGCGINRSHSDVAAWLHSQGVSVEFARDPEPGLTFEPLDVSRLMAEFGRMSNPFDQRLVSS